MQPNKHKTGPRVTAPLVRSENPPWREVRFATILRVASEFALAIINERQAAMHHAPQKRAEEMLGKHAVALAHPAQTPAVNGHSIAAYIVVKLATSREKQ